jgi:hypothetical protein
MLGVTAMKEKEMAQIPYIEHELRMFKAYERERRLKFMLTASNVFWVGLTLLLILAR